MNSNVKIWGSGLVATTRQHVGKVLDWTGKWLECATDGHAMVLVEVEQSQLPSLRDDVAKVALGYSAAVVPADALHVRLAHVLIGIGTVEQVRTEECSDCEGTGREPRSESTCTCECCACDRCGGTKMLEFNPKARIRFVRGVDVRFNANLLGMALACVRPDEPTSRVEETVSLSQEGAGLLVVGPGWRCIVMGMRESDHGEDLLAAVQTAPGGST